MNKNSFGVVGLSMFLLLGPAPGVLLAHEGHEHGQRQSGYEEREESEKYNPQGEDDSWEDEDEDDDTYRPSSRRYPPPDWERSYPSERRGRPW